MCVSQVVSKVTGVTSYLLFMPLTLKMEEKPKEQGVKSFMSLLSVLSVLYYLSILMFRKLQNDTVAQNWFCSWILLLLGKGFSVKKRTSTSSTKSEWDGVNW